MVCVIFYKLFVEFLDEVIWWFFVGKEKDDVKIIDVVVGIGLIGVELSKFGYINLCVLDILLEMLDEVKKKNVYKKFICFFLSDSLNFEIVLEEFDVLICGGLMFVGYIGLLVFIEMIRIIKIGKFIFVFVKYLL